MGKIDYARAIARETPHAEREERAALRCITTTIQARGYPPTRREILYALGKTSPSEAQACVLRLVRKGLIEIQTGTARGIRVTAAGMKADTEEM